MDTTALIVIDVQRGFDSNFWGRTANPAAEANIGRLVEAWPKRGPVVVVRHDSPNRLSPLHPSRKGNALKEVVADVGPALLVTKSVNSAFYGEPDLHRWLAETGIARLVVCGIQTNMCVETTARMAGNLGYEVTVPLDATRTFDIAQSIPGLGRVCVSAEQLMRTSAANLARGGFARVSTTERVLADH